MERLEKERMDLVVRRDELEDKVRQKATWVHDVPPEVVKKIKDDYLTSEEFQEEKFECTMDENSRGFNECIHHIRELDLSFDVTHLREDLSEGEEGEERLNTGE